METSQITEVDKKNCQEVEEGMIVIAEAPATEIIEEMAIPITVIEGDTAVKNTKIEHQNIVDMNAEKIMDQDPDHQLIVEAMGIQRVLFTQQDQEGSLLDERIVVKEALSGDGIDLRIDLRKKTGPDMIGAVPQLADHYRIETEMTVMNSEMEEDQ